MYLYKYCTKCNRWKFITLFGRTVRKYGRTTYLYNRSDCKDCHNAEKRIWNMNNKDKIAAYAKAWKEKYPNWQKDYYRNKKNALSQMD